MPFPFLDLPPEIRERIFEYMVLTPSNDLPLTLNDTEDNWQRVELTDGTLSVTTPQYTSMSAQATYPISLVSVCHDFYQRVRVLYWSLNSFSLSLNRQNITLAYFLHPDFQSSRRMLRTLHLTIRRWGTKTYFVDYFAPVLADMILAGCLRSVSVRLRREHVFGHSKSSVVIDSESDIKELMKFPPDYDGMMRAELRARVGSHTSVGVLLTILEDPYLEYVRLETCRDVCDFSLEVKRELVEDVTNLLDRSATATN